MTSTKNRYTIHVEATVNSSGHMEVEAEREEQAEELAEDEFHLRPTKRSLL